MKENISCYRVVYCSPVLPKTALHFKLVLCQVPFDVIVIINLLPKSYDIFQNISLRNMCFYVTLCFISLI